MAVVATTLTPTAASAAPTVAASAPVAATSAGSVQPARCTPPKLPKAPAGVNAAYPRFYRPVTKLGERDSSVRNINHVREAQYRLRWLGLYKGSISGYFGTATKDAVVRFQKKYCMKVTGYLTQASWQILIIKTIKARSKVPAACSKPGWHSCYDRATHQDFLFRNGIMWNVWLVRGGSRSEQTRTGNYTVFARYPYKVSSIYDVPMYYFQKHSGGQGQHGSGFMMDPFVGHSHGCINMYIKDAKVLWALTSKSKLRVHVYGAWS
jgi:hypothetical protein